MDTNIESKEQHARKFKLKETGLFVLKQVLAVLVALLLATIMISLSGFKPIAIIEGIGNALTEDFLGTLRWITPLIFTGLACAVAFKAGVWNMGVDGQLYMGSIAATAAALSLAGMPGYILLPVVVLAGILGGMLWAMLFAVLRVAFGANEIVTTILMNYLAFYFSDFCILGPLKGSGTYAAVMSSDIIPESVWFPLLIPKSSVSIGLLFALLLAVILYFVMNKTTFGYEMKQLGTNPSFASYGGIQVKKLFLKVSALSGAIAGFAGVVEILGVHHRLHYRFTSNLGFDGIVISIIANNNPLGVLASGGFFALLRNGSYNIERMSDVPRSMVLVVQALVIVFVGSQFVWKRHKMKKSQTDENDKNASVATVVEKEN